MNECNRAGEKLFNTRRGCGLYGQDCSKIKNWSCIIHVTVCDIIHLGINAKQICENSYIFH
jgi:hypothetical protein